MVRTKGRTTRGREGEVSSQRLVSEKAEKEGEIEGAERPEGGKDEHVVLVGEGVRDGRDGGGDGEEGLSGLVEGSLDRHGE